MNSHAICVPVKMSKSFSISAVVVAPAPEDGRVGSGQSGFCLFLLQGLLAPNRSDEAVMCCFASFCSY